MKSAFPKQDLRNCHSFLVGRLVDLAGEISLMNDWSSSFYGSFPYPSNAERQARWWQGYIFKSLVWLDQGPERKAGALLIWSSHLVNAIALQAHFCCCSVLIAFWKRVPHMCVYIYTQYIWRALFQNAISTNSKIEFAMPMPSLEIMFWKSALHRCVYKPAYIPIWNDLIQNSIYELGIGITSQFDGIALIAFWKSALHIHIYNVYTCTLHAHIYMHMCTHTERVVCWWPGDGA